MPVTIRDAKLGDIQEIAALLTEDARRRAASDPGLWKMHGDAPARISNAIRTSLTDEAPSFLQYWKVALSAGRLVGIFHAILLPVPPIYAGDDGPPGLIMEDSFVASEAPSGTANALLSAAEDALKAAGARILLASSVPGGAMERPLSALGYAPLTLYLARTGLTGATPCPTIRKTSRSHLAEITRLSALNRALLYRLDPFWKPHAQADDRFKSWIGKSLELSDRDLFVAVQGNHLSGYAISQPATQLHFPPAHDISGTGVIDDFFHEALCEPERLSHSDAQIKEARQLVGAAEAALARRGKHAALAVCPAAWASRRALLERAGYANALTWFIRR